MKTHDYGPGSRGYGHDYTWDPVDGGLTGSAMGWGSGIQRGDYLLLCGSGHDGRTRYQVTDIKYYLDPHDMWRATLKFAPRP